MRRSRLARSPAAPEPGERVALNPFLISSWQMGQAQWQIGPMVPGWPGDMAWNMTDDHSVQWPRFAIWHGPEQVPWSPVCHLAWPICHANTTGHRIRGRMVADSCVEVKPGSVAELRLSGRPLLNDRPQRQARKATAHDEFDTGDGFPG